MLSASRKEFTPSFSPDAFNAPKREPFALIPFSVIQALSGNVTRSGILVYCALATHADQDGHCWPGRTRLADITNLTERQISRATAELEKKGLLRKSYRANGMVDYYLLPVTNQATPPVTAVTPPLTPLSPRTNQGTTQKEQREAAPEPEAATIPPTGAHSDFASHQEQEPTPTATVIPLPSKTILPEDWQLPDDWRQWAEQHRPDLANQLDAIASNFADYHASKATRSASWIAEWRRWVNRERTPKATQTASTATQPASRYAHHDQPEKPVSAAVRAALELGEQRRVAMLIQNGIDPLTGLPAVRPQATTSVNTTRPAAQAAMPIMGQGPDSSYAARLAALEARIAARKAREAAEKEGG